MSSTIGISSVCAESVGRDASGLNSALSVVVSCTFRNATRIGYSGLERHSLAATKGLKVNPQLSQTSLLVNAAFELRYIMD
jgi:hypothetical protein